MSKTTEPISLQEEMNNGSVRGKSPFIVCCLVVGGGCIVFGNQETVLLEARVRIVGGS